MNRSLTLIPLGTLIAAVSLAAISDPVKTDSGSVASLRHPTQTPPCACLKEFPSRLRPSESCGGKWRKPRLSGMA